MPRKIRVNGISKPLGEININETKPISKFDRIPQRNGRQFSGRVTAQNIPTQHARSRILARPKSQQFQVKPISGLIRVD